MKLPYRSSSLPFGILTAVLSLLISTFSELAFATDKIQVPTESGFLEVDGLWFTQDLPNPELFTEEEIARQAWRRSGTVTYVYNRNRELLGAKRIYDTGGTFYGSVQTKDSLMVGMSVTKVNAVLLNISNYGNLVWDAPIEADSGADPIIWDIEPLDDGGAIVIVELGEYAPKTYFGDIVINGGGGEDGIAVARASAHGEWLWAQRITPLQVDIYDGVPLDVRINDAGQVIACALIHDIWKPENPIVEAIGKGTYENVFDLETGQLISVRGPQLFPGSSSALQVKRNPFGEGVWLSWDGSIYASSEEGEFSFLYENLFQELVRRVPLPGFAPDALTFRGLFFSAASLELFENGDILVLMDLSTSDLDTVWLGYVSRNGELQQVERLDLETRVKVRVDSGDRISFAAKEQNSLPDVLFGDYKRIEGDSLLTEGRVVYEPVKGPFSGLRTFNGGWRHHSDLAWVLPLDNGWFYSQALDAFVWTEPSAKSGNFWAFNSKTGDWLFSVVSNDGLLYSANTKSWIRINQ